LYSFEVDVAAVLEAFDDADFEPDDFALAEVLLAPAALGVPLAAALAAAVGSVGAAFTAPGVGDPFHCHSLSYSVQELPTIALPYGAVSLMTAPSLSTSLACPPLLLSVSFVSDA
jgi:hypothetical protein